MMSNSQNKPVLVAVKGDQPVLVQYAADEARRRRTELVVVHVYGVVLQDVGAVAAVTSSPRDDAEAQAVLGTAKNAVDHLPDAPSTRFVSEVGSIIETIEKHADQAQLLVVGTDEITWFERALGGTITRHLADHVTCPVIVVPPIPHLDELYGGVCVAVDADDEAAGPLRFAFEEADARQSPLIVLHVVTEGFGTEDVESGRIATSEVLAGWHEEFPNVVAITRVVVDDNVVYAAEHASKQLELLVVGRHRRHLLSGRATASRLVRETHCPLAVVDPAYGSDRAAGSIGVGVRR